MKKAFLAIILLLSCPMSSVVLATESTEEQSLEESNKKIERLKQENTDLRAEIAKRDKKDKTEKAKKIVGYTGVFVGGATVAGLIAGAAFLKVIDSVAKGFGHSSLF